MLQAILLGLISMLGNAEYLFGTSCLSRPLVMGALTGIVMGDIPTGVALGATLELAFMGAFSIGASISTRNDFWNSFRNSICNQYWLWC